MRISLRAEVPALVLLTAAILIDTAHAQSQNYPSRPIRWIVPFAPGGSTDIYSRVLAPKLSEAVGQQIVIDNRAGGSLRAELAARAPNDGYTIWMGQTNNLAQSSTPSS